MACPECFAYPWLRDHVSEESSRRGTCPSCGKPDQPLAPVSTLHGPFKNLLSCYERTEGSGTPIFDLVQGEWHVFSERLIECGGAKGLLKAIMDWGWPEDHAEPRFSPSEDYVRRGRGQMRLADVWREFGEKVMLDPARTLTFEGPELDELLFAGDLPEKRTANLPAGTVLHRSRLGFAGSSGNPEPFAGSEIGAPPPDKVRAGRANAATKIVLYCADQKDTAVAEVRPARGEYVSVAEIRVRNDLEILDLVSDPDPPNPFVEESPRYWIEFAELLSAFAEELAKPLRFRDDVRDYIPSQRLAEQIEKAGLTGIRYPSAMAPGGTNVVLFDPAFADVGASSLVEIVDARIEYRDVPEQKPMA